MNNLLELDFSYASPINFDPHKYATTAQQAQNIVETKSGAGGEFLGWLDLPLANHEQLFTKIDTAVRQMHRAKAQALVVIGIGGSYLGTHAITEVLQAPFASPKLPLYFAGHQMDAAYHHSLLDLLAQKRYALNVISKSGTTLEPALAFRFFWQDLNKKGLNSEERKELIFITTDGKKGRLKEFAQHHNLETFAIPDDVGGRYSVFTPVGLVPLAASGIDIRQLMQGAAKMRKCLQTTEFANNPALQYAAYRYGAYQMGKKIEILASYQSNLASLAEWWKQLFGESEGKDGRGIFPASLQLTTDLHSLGQWMQSGERSIFETVLDIQEVPKLAIPHDEEKNLDGLNYLSGRDLHAINRSAAQATLKAHHSGQVPCLVIRLKRLDEQSLGGLMYFFEYACSISAYMLGVNPFNQPGVETYKKNMFALLQQ